MPMEKNRQWCILIMAACARIGGLEVSGIIDAGFRFSDEKEARMVCDALRKSRTMTSFHVFVAMELLESDLS